jgi:hypothetical protein
MFPCLSGALELSKDTAGNGGKGEGVWSLGEGIAILWVDVLEGCIVR